jgi:protein-S-isoprenylcysteine O-methyltransferase Ste14
MLKILPPIWFFLFLIAALCLHFFIPDTHVFNIATTLVKIIGALVFVTGMALSMQGSKQFAENKTEILPTSPTNRVLVTNGLFKYSRNPMYLGMVTSLLGAAFFSGTLPMFLAALAQFLVLNTFFIPFEEAKLTRIFGDQYVAYQKSARRWI